MSINGGKSCPDYPFCPNKPYCSCFHPFESDAKDYMSIYLSGGYKFVSKTTKPQKLYNSLNKYENKARSTSNRSSSLIPTVRTPRKHNEEIKLPLLFRKKDGKKRLGLKDRMCKKESDIYGRSHSLPSIYSRKNSANDAFEQEIKGLEQKALEEKVARLEKCFEHLGMT